MINFVFIFSFYILFKIISIYIYKISNLSVYLKLYKC